MLMTKIKNGILLLKKNIRYKYDTISDSYIVRRSVPDPPNSGLKNPGVFLEKPNPTGFLGFLGFMGFFLGLGELLRDFFYF